MNRYVALLVCLAGMAEETAAKDRFDEVRAFIRTQMADGDVAGVAVALSQHGKIVWEEGFGWADRERRIPATEHTLFSLASISKPVTATGLMTLVQAGRIELDKPVNDYLGDTGLTARVGNANDATVRRVANHSSGLPLHYHLIYGDEAKRQPAMDQTLLRYGNLITAPGERFEYSNLGYGVIDHLLTRISGKSYADFMSAEVFAPLGLTHMSVGIGPRLEHNVAVRYHDDGTPIPSYGSDHAGASAIYGSAHDLVRFAMFHLKDRLADQRQILSDAAIDEMQRLTFSSEEHAGHGVAWRIVTRADGYRTVEHGGGMPGVGTVLLLIPSEDIAVTVLTNRRQGRHRAIADKMLQVVLPEWQSRPKQEWGAAVPFQPTPELRGKWVGTIHTARSEIPLTMEFNPGQVLAGLKGQHASVVKHIDFKDGWFKGSMAGALDNDDVNWRGPHVLELSLKLRGDLLNGGATATAEHWRAGALTHWVELRKLP